MTILLYFNFTNKTYSLNSHNILRPFKKINKKTISFLYNHLKNV